MKTAPSPQYRELAEIDRHFARFIGGFGGGELPARAAAALSRNVRLGHICLDLLEGPAQFGEEDSVGAWPSLEKWRPALQENKAFGGPDDTTPLVLDEAGRLYLRKYWEYEKALAEAILSRAGGKPRRGKPPQDLQQLAVETALARRFVVISGGPGTGKTTTVLKILLALQERAGKTRLRIALAAPTGKAAARLGESLSAGSGAAARAWLPTEASTLHRLLGSREGAVSFRHHAKNPLPVDVVVVDEASMVPLTMMARLFDALPPRANVILLGDRHQLASVEPGHVLNDIAEAAGEPNSPLNGCLVTLRKNYRFGDDSRIFEFSSAVREGDEARVQALFEAGDSADLAFATTPPASRLAAELRSKIIDGYSGYLRESDPAKALELFQNFRVLCAFRSGPYGVENLNRKIEGILREAGLFGEGRFHAGLPVLVTRNDYQVRLFNGDVGIILPGESGALAAWFPGEEGTMRSIPPTRLPEWEPAFAMTVHKSQGSEYDNVLLILPGGDTPDIPRELVYTGLTRARQRVELWCEQTVLFEAIKTPARRKSGLRERLGGRGVQGEFEF